MKGTMLEPFEVSFAGALLDTEHPIPCGITAHNAAIPTRRFAVYRNNVVAGLVKALKSRFPVVEKIVGEEFFAAMARVFVVERPPRSPLLATYGDVFPAFIAAFEPARELPYLADVARLEAARTRSYHAADATPVGAGHFAAINTHAVGGIRVGMHPSTEIVRSPYPVVTIWAMNSGEQELAPIENWRSEDALVSARISTWRSARCRRVAQHSCSRSQEADRLTRRPRSHLPTIRISISLATSRGSSARGSSGTSSSRSREA